LVAWQQDLNLLFERTNLTLFVYFFASPSRFFLLPFYLRRPAQISPIVNRRTQSSFAFGYTFNGKFPH